MIREAIGALVAGKSLSLEEAAAVMEEIMTDQATPAQFGAFVTALRLKGETADEIAGMARVMREKALRLSASGDMVDTCGTGGDSSGTFNISTAAALVVAGCGVKVAKHGNRAMSGACGSADVLEELGMKIDLSPNGVAHCLEEVGMGFMFAQVFHPAMRFAAGPRREIGIRTVFNILGPLTNPAHARAQVIGVFDGAYGERIAQVLQRLGAHHALVVHSSGIDELTLSGQNQVWELRQGRILHYTLDAQQAGLAHQPPEALKGGDRPINASILRGVLEGRPGPHRDVVLLNAAAALVAADRVSTLAQGVVAAAQAIDSGAARQKLERLVALSQTLT